ncbi:hypothetical protein GALMADRAFT_222018 [Galerina marginata CBS 339.88]|uniref:Uncharacterized protein n=1 Tax=Galerina marginata (strain CBS 339.88) TaxID=685588 RepID=A0A067TIG1_GALM3|nr:hypothetical protein GALMADRAFT_222018 [Galerina marginata CBS 339.88]
MSTNVPVRGQGVVTSRGKRPKRFLEKNDALSLAVSIADIQEKKTLTRAEKHKDQAAVQLKSDRKRVVNSKAKIKEKKALLRARSAEAKKGRAKTRKDQLKGSEYTTDDTSSRTTHVNPDKAAHKKVSFA